MDVPSWPQFVGKTAYAVTYAVVVTAVASVLLAVVSFLFGYGLGGVKFGQFVLGWVVFGYAVFQLRPRAAWKQDWESEKTAGERLDRAAETESEDDASEREKAEESARFLDPFSDRRRVGNREDRFGAEESAAFRDFVARLPPAAFAPIEPPERPREGVLAGLTALCVLAFSFVLEAWFGV